MLALPVYVPLCRYTGLPAGHRLLAAGRWFLDFRRWLPAAGRRSLAAGRWTLAAGCK